MLRNSSHFLIFLKRSTHVFVTVFLISLFTCDPSACSGGRHAAVTGKACSTASSRRVREDAKGRGVARGVSPGVGGRVSLGQFFHLSVSPLLICKMGVTIKLTPEVGG